MKYSLDKYKYFQYKNENGGTTIAAASTYGGHTVKGYAKCNPEDEFNFERGKELAAARCNMKIANKRVARAAEKYMEAVAAIAKAQAHFEEMKQYYMDAVDQADEASENLKNLISNFK